MKNFKRIVLIIVAAACAFFMGCNKKNEAQGGGKIKVVSTIFPIYDWAKNVTVGSGKVELEMLVKKGEDMHSFQPSAGDIVKISTCDLLIYAGGESDGWVNDALKNAQNKNMKVLNLMEYLGDSVKEEEIVEGMESEEETAGEMVVTTGSTTAGTGSSDAEEAASTDDEVEYDEHIWLSLVNAKLSCEAIAQSLNELDAENSAKYSENLAAYTSKIDGLWTFANDQNKETIVVCDRFPFRYMVDDLGMKYFAAFAGCSAETEASFETIAFLSRKVQELGVHRVYVTESSDRKIADTVIKNAGLEGQCEIKVLNSMQNVTMAQAQNGLSYVEIMKKNFEELK